MTLLHFLFKIACKKYQLSSLERAQFHLFQLTVNGFTDIGRGTLGWESVAGKEAKPATHTHTHTHTHITWQKITCWEVWRQKWNQKPQPRTREAAALSLLVVWIGIRELFQVVSVEIMRHLECVGASRPLSVWSAARAHTVQVAATVCMQVYSYWLISMYLDVSWLNHLNKQTELKGQHNILFYFVYMWRTLPPLLLQTVRCGPYFPQITACLFSNGKDNIR